MSNSELEGYDYESKSKAGGENIQQTQSSRWGSTTSTYDCPSLLLKTFAKGPFNPKNLLLQFVTNLDMRKKNCWGRKKLEMLFLCHRI